VLSVHFSSCADMGIPAIDKRKYSCILELIDRFFYPLFSPNCTG
jgi:hypothetical protein